MLASVFVRVFVTLAAVTLFPAGPPSARPAPAPKAATVGAPLTRLRVVRADELYSLRARRRFASYLRMRLLELREERLDRAADAIERRLSPDELLRE